MSPLRLLLVDDHPVVRDGLSGMFGSDPGFEVVGQAGDGETGVAMAAHLTPDVVLMDLRMPNMDGLAAIREIKRLGIDTHVLVLTTYDTDRDVLPAIEAGATGYLLKDAPKAELFRAVRAAAKGETALSPAVASRLVGAMQAPSGAGTLSQREREILSLIARGAANKEVARQLCISEATVKTHLAHAYSKLEVSDRAAAVARALELGALT